MAIDMNAVSVANNQLPYVATPFAEGLTAEDFRIQHQAHGERVRWWKAMPLKTAEGKRDFIEQYLKSDVRVLLSENNLEVTTPEGIKIRVGDIKKSSLPDELEMAEADRILALDRSRIDTQTITPSGTNLDNLPHIYLRGIDMVTDASGVLKDALHYELYGRAIRWRGTFRPEGKVTVRYYFHPMYEFRGEGNNQAILGMDDKRLPQIIPLHLVAAGRENE